MAFFTEEMVSVLLNRSLSPRVQVLNPAALMEAAPSETEKEGGYAETVLGESERRPAASSPLSFAVCL